MRIPGSALALASLFLFSSSASAQWLLNGTPVCSYPSLQSLSTAVPDGSGGSFVFWYDSRSPTSIYAQHLDSGGHILWSADGVSMASNVTASDLPIYGVSDGTGGAFFAYSYAGAPSGVYVQRINSAGSKLWGSGVLIDSWGTTRYPVALISDGRRQEVAGSSPGVIIAYQDNLLQPEGTVYVDDIDNSGTRHWQGAGYGVPLDTTANAFAYYVAMVSDGHPGPTLTSPMGAILAWTRSNSNRLYAQRILYNGAPQWGTNGTPVCSAIGYQYAPSLALLYSGNAIVEWDDSRSGAAGFGIYAQHLPLGSWDPTGVLISHMGPPQATPPALSGDNAGGALSVWPHQDPATNETDLYSQRIDANGIVRWQTDGLPLCTQPKNQDIPSVVSDGNTGAIVVWRDHRSGTDDDIYAQHVDSTGVTTWNPDGIPVCVAASDQYPRSVIADGAGGAIATWDDHRYGIGKEYTLAQHIASDGGLVAAESKLPSGFRALPAFPNPASGPTTFRFQLPTPARVSAAIYDVEGRLVREMIDRREMPAGVQSLRWDGRGSSGERLASGVYLFEVRAGNEKSSSRLLLLGTGRKD